LDPYAIVLIRQTSLPITSSGKVQRNLCREQYLAGELKTVHAWTNPAPASAAAKKAKSPAAAASGRVDVQLHGEGVALTHVGADAAVVTANGAEATNGRRAVSSVEVDRAAEQIETWLLEWIVARLGLDVGDVSRDRPFAEFGVDSLTAVELSQELEDEFKVPLPPIVAWNYPTPAALARYLAEQSLGVGEKAEQPSAAPATNGAAAGASPSVSLDGANDDELTAMLAEIENLSDEEAARLLAEEQRGAGG
jgi:acyl carrier protein